MQESAREQFIAHMQAVAEDSGQQWDAKASGYLAEEWGTLSAVMDEVITYFPHDKIPHANFVASCEIIGKHAEQKKLEPGPIVLLFMMLRHLHPPFRHMITQWEKRLQEGDDTVLDGLSECGKWIASEYAAYVVPEIAEYAEEDWVRC